MRNSKSIIPSFAFYDRTGIQNYLEKQSEKGWLLERVTSFLWKFRRTQPRNRHFAVVYFPGADAYDPAPGDAEETFREFCAHDGWTLAGSNAQMQIFYSEEENPTPIETDPVLEVENIHRSMKKSMLPAYWLLELSCVLQLVLQWMALRNDLLIYLSAGTNLYAAVTWVLLSGAAISRHLCYVRWRQQAKTAAERDNVFLETKSTAKAENLVAVLILLGFGLMILTMEDRHRALVMGLSVLAVWLTMALTRLVYSKLKKGGYDAAYNKKATMITSVVSMLLLVMVVVPRVSNAVVEKFPELRNEPEKLIVNIWELLDRQESEFGTLRLTEQESPFLGYQRIFQYTEEDPRGPTLEYNLARVKADFLYDRLREELMIIPQHIENGEFRAVDPTPWGAEQVWQLRDGEDMLQWYVVCFEDFLLEIVPDWEMTDDQKTQIGELLG